MPPRPLRFVQTGDWHLGQSYGAIPDPSLADRLREARLSAVARVLAEARRLGAAFVLAAGDQFDTISPDPRWVSGMFDAVASAPEVVVHMIPGNHDPLMPGSVYARAEFRRAPANLVLHREPVPVALEAFGATLFPCPCFDRAGPDPTRWIPPRAESDGLRIGLAHGSLPNFGDADNRNYPIPDDAPSRHDLDYLALGDWHTANPDPRDWPDERMYYAGAPEVGGWDETGAGSALLVELADAARPRVVPLAVGEFSWLEVRKELHGEDDVAALTADLARIAGPRSLARVRASGALTAELRGRLDGLLEALRPQFAALVAKLDDLRLAVEDDAPTVSDPLIRSVFERLARLSADPLDGLPASLPTSVPAPDRDSIGRARALFRDLLP